VKFEGYADEEANKYFVPMKVPTVIKSILKPIVSRSEDVPVVLTEEAWDTVCAYLVMLDQKLPELQEVIAESKLDMMEKVMAVEDELGAVVAELGSGIEIPGGHYVNLWSGIGVDLENNQAVANLVGRIVQQVKSTAGRVCQASQRAYQAITEVAGVREQVVGVLRSRGMRKSRSKYWWAAIAARSVDGTCASRFATRVATT
jgi:hypothetical protein